MSKEQEKILEYVEATGEADEEQGDEVYNDTTARKLLAKLAKARRANTTARQKHAGDPAKFFETEEQLDESIKALSVLSQLDSYRELTESGMVLVSLFQHENADIVDEAVKILGELTDDDVAADPDSVERFIQALLRCGLVDAIAGYLGLIEEEQRTDSEQAQSVLSLIENLCLYEEASIALVKSQVVVSWLVRRITGVMNATKQASAELMAALLLSIENPTDRDALKYEHIDSLLVQVSRGLDSKVDGDIQSTIDDILDSLRLAVENAKQCEMFLDAEGVELMILLLSNKKNSERAIALLDTIARGELGGPVAMRLVQKGGLKPLFHVFGKKKGAILNGVVGIFSGMLRWLDLESPERVRLVAKFVEKDFDKLSKLVAFRGSVGEKIRLVSETIAQERKVFEAQDEIDPEERLVRETDWDATLADAGIETLRNIDSVLAWLYVDGVTSSAVLRLVAERSQSFDSVIQTLKGMSVLLLFCLIALLVVYMDGV
jgi:beta-catenin-like protein 1